MKLTATKKSFLISMGFIHSGILGEKVSGAVSRSGLEAVAEARCQVGKKGDRDLAIGAGFIYHQSFFKGSHNSLDSRC